MTKVPKLRHIVKHVELGTALTTSVGSLAETIAVHMVPEWSHNDSLGNVADVLELVATGAGITAACASYGKAYKVGMVACAADGIITLLSVITGTCQTARISRDIDMKNRNDIHGDPYRVRRRLIGTLSNQLR